MQFKSRLLTVLKGLLLLLLTLLCAEQSYAQKERVISGRVTDASNGQPIPFVTVTTRETLIGTVTNDDGGFDLHVPDSIKNDNLIITLIGYKLQEYPLSTIISPLSVNLQPDFMEMKEVQIKPQPPTYYLLLAARSMKANYPEKPFESQSYYRENISENGGFLRSAEGVFRTYYPGFQDTVKNQHQLMLFQKAETLAELAFMKKEREKSEAKDKKREEKKARKGKPTEKKKSDSSDSLKIGELFGGPENLLRMADIVRSPESCIDSTMFDEYTYSFARSSTFNSAELMVINFKSRGKVDKVREEGKIYLDIASNAVVKIETNGTMVIPALVRPVLFVMGIGVENPKFNSNIEFQQVKDRWYPKNMQFNMNINVEKKRMFAANDHSVFKIFGVLVVNKIDIGTPTPVEKLKRYSSEKKPEEQVFNDLGLTWDQINVIKR